MKSKITHVGWVTNDQQRFEDFWCKGMGFVKVWEAQLMPEKTKVLFRTDSIAKAIRYEKDGDTIEIHIFVPTVDVYSDDRNFHRFGINHICLHIEGSRDEFIKELSTKVQYLEIRRFHDAGDHEHPEGWDNIFIRDYDGNWIELRENL